MIRENFGTRFHRLRKAKIWNDPARAIENDSATKPSRARKKEVIVS
jgi:hypothetical protein